MMSSLDSDQIALLLILAAARKNAKKEFHARFGDDLLRIYHGGLQREDLGMEVNPLDLKALQRLGLIVTTRTGERGDLSFEVTPDGVQHAEFYRRDATDGAKQ